MKMHLTVTAEVDFDDPLAVKLFHSDPDNYLDCAVRHATGQVSGWFGSAVSGKVSGTVTAGGYGASYTDTVTPAGDLETALPKSGRKSSGVKHP